MSDDPSGIMFAKAKELLWRQRQIEPFPLDTEEVFLSLFPKSMREVSLAGDEWWNINVCLTRSTAAVIELLGEAGSAYWLKFDHEVVAPGNGATLRMCRSNPHYPAIHEWWTRASVIHAELSEYQSILWDFFQRAEHPAVVGKHWPEILPFVDFELQPSHYTPDIDKKRNIPPHSGIIREGIIHTLAGSTLLPPYDCMAWVDYETEY